MANDLAKREQTEPSAPTVDIFYVTDADGIEWEAFQWFHDMMDGTQIMKGELVNLERIHTTGDGNIACYMTLDGEPVGRLTEGCFILRDPRKRIWLLDRRDFLSRFRLGKDDLERLIRQENRRLRNAQHVGNHGQDSNHRRIAGPAKDN